MQDGTIHMIGPKRKSSESRTIKRNWSGRTKCCKRSGCVLLILDGGNRSHTEFGMAIALEKTIYVYHAGNPLQTTFYHLPEINIFEGDVAEFASYVMNHVK